MAYISGLLCFFKLRTKTASSPKGQCKASTHISTASTTTLCAGKNIETAKQLTKNKKSILSSKHGNSKNSLGDASISETELAGQDNNEPKEIIENSNNYPIGQKSNDSLTKASQQSASNLIYQSHSRENSSNKTLSKENFRNSKSHERLVETNTPNNELSELDYDGHEQLWQNTNAPFTDDANTDVSTKHTNPCTSLSIPQTDGEESYIHAVPAQEYLEHLEDDVPCPNIGTITVSNEEKINATAEASTAEIACADDCNLSTNPERNEENSLLQGEILAQRDIGPILNGKHIPDRPYAHHFAENASLNLQVYKAEREPKDKYQTLRSRMLTFKSYQSEHVLAIECAKAGFISKQQEDQKDTLLCVWCLLVLRNFEQTVDVFATHKLCSSACTYLRIITHKRLTKAPQLLDLYDIGKSAAHT